MADEKISVVLEADSRQLTAEFAKARQSAEQFAAKTLPAVKANLEVAERQGARLAKGMKDMERPTRSSGAALMQMAQFADDAQYGLRGIVNNIPGLLMSLGVGTGLAGVLSLVTVAGVQLLPVLRKLFSDADPEAVQKYADALGEVRKKAEELAAEKGKAFAVSFVAALDDEEEAIGRQNRALAANVELMRLRAALAKNVAAARDELESSQVRNDPSLSREERERRLFAIQARAAQRRAAERLEELKARREAANQSSKAANDAASRNQQDIAETRRQIAEREKELQLFKERQAAADLAEGSLPSARARLAELEKGPTSDLKLSGSPQERIEQYQKALEEARRFVAELEGTLAANGAGAKRRGLLTGELEGLQAGLAELQKKQEELNKAARTASDAKFFERQQVDLEIEALKKQIELEKQRLLVERKGSEERRKNDEMAERAKQQARAKAAATDTRPPASEQAGDTIGDRSLQRERQVALSNAARRDEQRRKIRRAGGIAPASLWGGVGEGGVLGSLRGGVGAAAMPGLGPGYRVQRGIGPHAAAQLERGRQPGPSFDSHPIVAEVAALREDIKRAGAGLGLL